MSKETPIQFSDSAANPVMGCDGCELWTPAVKACYAGVMHERYKGKSKGYAKEFTTPELFPGRMAETLKWKDLTGTKRPDKPWLDGMPRMVFVSDMGDALSEGVPFEFLSKEIVQIALRSPHTYLWFTKRPKRMAEFSKWLAAEKNFNDWPDNLWAVASVTDQVTADARVPELLKVPAKVRGVSYEPAWGPVQFRHQWLGADKVSWVTMGGQSGKDPKPCDVYNLRRAVREFHAAGVFPFVKQLGAAPFTAGMSGLGSPDGNQYVHKFNLADSHGGDWKEWPEDLRVREFPTTPLSKKHNVELNFN